MPTTSARDQLRTLARRAMIERGLQPDFPPAAAAETAALRDAPPPDAAQLRDLRDWLWCSIDNDDSRDLDQLTYAQEAPGGATRLFVAVADVDARVHRGSAIDEHARANTTSVYTPAQIFPMLPERLSTDLTSLGESDDRAAVVVELTVGADGTVTSSSVSRARVRNHAKLAYDSVAAWLDGRAPAPAPLAAVPGLDACLRLQDRVTQAMRELRHANGALTLEAVEAHAVFDGDTLADLAPDEKNRAKALIEDAMIAANTAVARFLSTKGYASIRRVLREPRRWDRIVAVAREVGESLPETPDARALDAFLRERHRVDPDRFPDLSLAVVKSLGSGEYAMVGAHGEVDGHFGLAVRDYAHSTAPNRRYPDLIAQRLVKAALAGAPAPYSDGELQALAKHCTEQEDAAEKVERQMRKSAAALLLSSRIGHQFDAIVTGASDKGTWVRIRRPAAEGRVVRGERGLDVGEHTRVELVATDVERGYIDFARVR